MSKKSAITICYVLCFVVVFLLLPGFAAAIQQDLKNQSPDSQTTQDAAEPKNPPVPNLSDIIPEAAAMNGRYAELKTYFNQIPDFSAVEKQFAEIGSEVQTLSSTFKRLQGEGDYDLSKLYSLRQAILGINNKLERVSEPLKQEIDRIDGRKKQWQTEKSRWSDWRSSLLKDQGFEQLNRVLREATDTINGALNIIDSHLEQLLALQAKGGSAEEGLGTLEAEVRGRISRTKHQDRYSKYPPMFSRDYYSQFDSALWHTTIADLRLTSWPFSGYFASYGWIFLLQIFCIALLLFLFYKNRRLLETSEHWQFLTERPFSSALFIVIFLSFFLILYEVLPNSMKFAYTTVGSIATVRILARVVARPLRRHVAYTVMIVFIVSQLVDVAGLPVILTRLYILLASLAVFLFLCNSLRNRSSHNETELFVWSMWGFAGLFMVIAAAGFLGHEGVAELLFFSTIRSLALILPFILLMHIISGALHWVFFLSPVWKVKLLRSQAEYCVKRGVFLFAAATCGLVLLPGIMGFWYQYDSMSQALKSVYSLGFDIGTLRITLGIIIVSATVFYLALLTSKILPRVILDETITGRKLTRGVRRSIAQLMRYCLIFAGFLLAFLTLGFDFTKLTIILSAFGVGIGFGLQNVVNNFVCGLILLFERPLTEGDTIEMGSRMAHIKKIGLRATVVETLDMADLIIPNADLINTHVTNWTLTNRQVRVSIPVGVAYGSDVSRVVETLLACATGQSEVVKTPHPEVLFVDFGDSSLDFELRVWIKDVDRRLQVRSELCHEIDRQFRDNNIVIPFPQRDVHFQGVDKVLC
ncbi:MAG: mechanosensitive ion channel domain-containing protein [Desulforhopalus sp.]